MSGARRRAGTHAPVALTFAVLLVASGAACSDDEDLLVADGPVIAWSLDAEPDGMDAILLGQLEVEDGCTFLDDGSATSAVVWPRDTSWDPDREAVVTTDGKRIRVGEPVQVAGGYVPLDADVEVVGAARDLLDGCRPSSGELAVAGADATVQQIPSGG